MAGFGHSIKGTAHFWAAFDLTEKYAFITRATLEHPVSLLLLN
jgi:hypothetical protein